jgi:hypothetical protein
MMGMDATEDVFCLIDCLVNCLGNNNCKKTFVIVLIWHDFCFDNKISLNFYSSL